MISIYLLGLFLPFCYVILDIIEDIRYSSKHDDYFTYNVHDFIHDLIFILSSWIGTLIIFFIVLVDLYEKLNSKILFKIKNKQRKK